jgi:hypothetical protein
MSLCQAPAGVDYVQLSNIRELPKFAARLLQRESLLDHAPLKAHPFAAYSNFEVERQRNQRLFQGFLR